MPCTDGCCEHSNEVLCADLEPRSPPSRRTSAARSTARSLCLSQRHRCVRHSDAAVVGAETRALLSRIRSHAALSRHHGGRAPPGVQRDRCAFHSDIAVSGTVTRLWSAQRREHSCTRSSSSTKLSNSHSGLVSTRVSISILGEREGCWTTTPVVAPGPGCK